jgi:transcription termination factor NusB
MVFSRSRADVFEKFNLPYMKFKALPREQIRGYSQDPLQTPFSESTPTGFSIENPITTSNSSIQGTTIDRLVMALIQDTVLQALYSDVLRKKRFVENLRRLLIQYSQELESKALHKSEKQAAYFLQKQAHLLATRISVLYDTKIDEVQVAMRRLARQHSDNSSQLETWIQSHANENSGGKITAVEEMILRAATTIAAL